MLIQSIVYPLKNIYLPCFEISGIMDLRKTYAALGIKELFNSEKCNLSKMFSSYDEPKKVKIIHQAAINVSYN